MWLVVIVPNVGGGQGPVIFHEIGKELGPGVEQAADKFNAEAPVPFKITRVKPGELCRLPWISSGAVKMRS